MYELLMQNTWGLEQVDRGDNQPAIDAMIVPSRAGRASLWARSRPCVVGGEPAVRRCGAEPAVHRRGRGSDHAAPGRPPRPTSLLRRRSRGVRGIRGVLRRASGAQFLIAWTWLRAALHHTDDGAVAHPAAGCAAAVDSLAPDVAAASEGCAAPLLGLLPSSWHQRAAAMGAALYHLGVFAGIL